MAKANTKQRIINQAIQLFADKGYDGTSVDEIAQNVSINKATVYHHFKSKKHILNTIIHKLIQNTITFRQELVQEIIKAKADDLVKVEEIVKKQADKRYNFLKDRKQTFTILLMEILKKENKENYLLKYIDTTLNLVLKNEDEQTLHKKFNMDDKMKAAVQKPESLVSSVFLGVLPMICFMVINEKFSRHYNLNTKETEKLYRNLMADVAAFLRKRLL